PAGCETSLTATEVTSPGISYVLHTMGESPPNGGVMSPGRVPSWFGRYSSTVRVKFLVVGPYFNSKPQSWLVRATPSLLPPSNLQTVAFQGGVAFLHLYSMWLMSLESLTIVSLSFVVAVSRP